MELVVQRNIQRDYYNWGGMRHVGIWGTVTEGYRRRGSFWESQEPKCECIVKELNTLRLLRLWERMW